MLALLKKRSVILLTVTCALLAACSRKAQVALYIDGANGRTLSLYEIDAENGARQIAQIKPNKHGKAKMSLPDAEGFYMLLREDGVEGLPLLAPQNLHIEACYDSLVQTAVISNSKRQAPNEAAQNPTPAAVQYQRTLMETEEAVTQISRQWIENRYQSDDADALYRACTQKIDSLRNAAKQEAMRLCREYTYSLLPVFIVNKQLAGRDLFDFEDPQDVEFLLEAAYAMQRAMPQNPHTERFVYNIERIKSYQNQMRLEAVDKTE